MTDTVSVRQSELDLERGRVAERYARLDALREEKERQLAAVRRTGPQGSLQNHSERDAFASLYEDRLAQLYAVDDRLVFGRLDLDAHAHAGELRLQQHGQAHARRAGRGHGQTRDERLAAARPHAGARVRAPA